jgi:hypothetical protein
MASRPPRYARGAKMKKDERAPRRPKQTDRVQKKDRVGGTNERKWGAHFVLAVILSVRRIKVESQHKSSTSGGSKRKVL